MSADWQGRLEAIYGSSAQQQRDRYQSAIQRFGQVYGPGAARIYRVPGRVNLIGEHTDYQQGYVLPVALDKDLLFLARSRSDATVSLQNTESGRFPPRRFTISGEIAPGSIGDWRNYAQGAAQMLYRVAGRALCGADILVVGEPPYGVPRGAGLSSSSALTVGIALVLAEMNELHIPFAELAWFCGEAEWYVGTRGGIMDQFIALLGKRDHALFLDCRARSYTPDGVPRFHIEQVPLPQGFSIVVTDTKQRHQNVRSAFNVRVAEGRIGVALLQRHFPEITHLRDLERYDWAEIEPLLPEMLTRNDLLRLGLDLSQIMDVKLTDSVDAFWIRKRCRHVVTENARVRASMAALRVGAVKRFGAILDEAHASVRDDYEASCPELEVLIRLAKETEGVIGTRMTGAGWGGCTISLVHKGFEDLFAAQVRARYHKETGVWPNIFVCHAGERAGFVGWTEAV